MAAKPIIPSGNHPAALTIGGFALAMALGCGGRPPKIEQAPRDHSLLLANVRGGQEAELLALISGGRWTDSFSAGKDRVGAVVKSGVP